MAVALDLFERRGYDGVTIEEIAEAADVAPRTFFRYFPTKETLLYHDADEQLDVLRDSIRDAPEDALPIETLQMAIAALARHTLSIRERQYQMARLASDSPSIGAYQRTVLQPLTEQAVVEAFATRLGVDPEVDRRPALLAMLGVLLMSAVGRAWVRSEGSVDIETLIAEHVDLLADLTRE